MLFVGRARLRSEPKVAMVSIMIPTEVAQTALALPEAERLELARRLVESVAVEGEADALAVEGVRRIEEVVCGKVIPLTEEQFRDALE